MLLKWYFFFKNYSCQVGQNNMFMQKYWNKFISIEKISLDKLKVKFEIDWVLMIFCFIGLYENYNEI